MSCDLKPLGLAPVTMDIKVKTCLGPLCLSSFQALKQSQWKLYHGTTKTPCVLDSQASTTMDSSTSVSSPREHSLESNSDLPVLVITTYRSLQDWKKCCICLNSFCSGNHRNRCPGIQIVTGESVPCLDPFTSMPSSYRFVCTTYGTLNACAERFRRQPWRAIILEYSNTIPFPNSYTVKNLFNLSCSQWFTVNLHILTGRSRFVTRWQDIHLEARELYYFANYSAESREKAANTVALSSITGSFWSFMEPGVGSDCGAESNDACRSLIGYLAEWLPGEANEQVRLSCPILNDGMWFIRAEPCTNDKQLLSVAAQNIQDSKHEELFNEFFQATHCPIDFASIPCLVCGNCSIDAVMVCCGTVYHRDCLLNELLCDLKCPNCDTELANGAQELQEGAMKILEEGLLVPDTYCIIDLQNAYLRHHDWTCQLTRQVITSAIQNHLTSWARSTGSAEVRCLTARVHNGESLSNEVLSEARSLSLHKRMSTYSKLDDLASMETTVIYVLFITKNTPIRIKPAHERQKFIIVTLVPGIFDQIIQPLIPDADLTITYKLL